MLTWPFWVLTKPAILKLQENIPNLFFVVLTVLNLFSRTSARNSALATISFSSVRECSNFWSAVPHYSISATHAACGGFHSFGIAVKNSSAASLNWTRLNRFELNRIKHIINSTWLKWKIYLRPVNTEAWIVCPNQPYPVFLHGYEYFKSNKKVCATKIGLNTFVRFPLSAYDSFLEKVPLFHIDSREGSFCMFCFLTDDRAEYVIIRESLLLAKRHSYQIITGIYLINTPAVYGTSCNRSAALRERTSIQLLIFASSLQNPVLISISRHPLLPITPQHLVNRPENHKQKPLDRK